MQICMADNEEKKKPFDRLEYFRVAHNPFHAWTIPTELSSCMPNLERLFLQATSLTGTLPSDISELSRLRKSLIDWLYCRNFRFVKCGRHPLLYSF